MLSLVFLAVVTLSHVRTIEQNKPLSAYGFIREVAIPLGEEIRRRENILRKKEIFGRIIDGSISNEGQFPYQAGVLTQYVGIEGTGICGGSLITVNRVVYAAHCWSDGEYQGYSVEIVLGSTTFFYGGTRQNTTNIITHPQWYSNNTDNDVAVIYLTTSVEISNNIAPIDLPSGCQLRESFAGETAIASGFGKIRDSGDDSPPILRHVNLTVITNAMCSYFHTEIDDSKLCTFSNNGSNICKGDSGGPLAITKNRRPLLIGITIFASNLGCEEQRPAGFTRITHFIEFLKEHM